MQLFSARLFWRRIQRAGATAGRDRIQVQCSFRQSTGEYTLSRAIRQRQVDLFRHPSHCILMDMLEYLILLANSLPPKFQAAEAKTSEFALTFSGRAAIACRNSRTESNISPGLQHREILAAVAFNKEMNGAVACLVTWSQNR